MREYNTVVLRKLTVAAGDLVTGSELGGGCDGVVFAGRLRGFPVGVKRLRAFLDPALYALDSLDSKAYRKQLQLLEHEVSREKGGN